MAQKKKAKKKARKDARLPELVTVTQAAEHLEVTRQAIYDAIKRGRLTSVKLGTVRPFRLIPRNSFEHYRDFREVGGRPKKKIP